AKSHLEARFGVRRRDVRNGRLLADHELQLWNEVDDQRTVRAQCLLQLLPPFGELGLGLAEKLTNQRLERLRQRGVRHIALELIELARREQASLRDQHLVQLADNRRLSYAGVAADEQQLRLAARDGGTEGSEQGVDLAVASVQLFRHQQAIGMVVLRQ